MKYIDNYILSILLGLELGKTINFNSIDDLPEQIRTNEDRRLEKNFIGKLKDTVLNALPQAEQDKLLSKTKYSIDKDSINVGISASEMNLQTLDDVLKYIETSNNNFPIAKAPDTTEILTGLPLMKFKYHRRQMIRVHWRDRELILFGKTYKF